MIINHNCCIKLVRLVIFIYDAWSHTHQMLTLSHVWSFILNEDLCTLIGGIS